MSSKPAAKPRVVASNKTLDLAAEAADMESKLSELRRAMEKERAKREQTQGDGPIWRNGATGLLRTKFRAQSGPSTGPQSAGSSRASSSQSAQKPAPHSAAPPAAMQEPITGPSRLYSNYHPASGMQAPVHMPVAGTSAPVGSASTWGGRTAPISSRQPPSAQRGGGQQATSGGVQEGMSCGTDDNDNLMEGNFNEADSHKSFLDALNEWRNANRTASTSKDSKPEPSGGSATAGTAMEVQTEVGTSAARARPASGKQLSYFDKLLLNSQSRQAGQAASGGSTPPTNNSRPSTSNTPGLPAIDMGSSHRAHPASTSSGVVRPSQQVYSLDAALNTPLPPLATTPTSRRGSLQGGAGTPGTGGRHKGLDILEELEALELQQHHAAQGYDSEDEFSAHGYGRRTSAHAQPDIVVTNATGMMGLTKGVRLPDAILVPSEEADKDDDA